MEVRVVAGAAAAAAVAADEIARRLRAAVSSRRTATFAVSGGRTPELMLGHLAAADLAWHVVTVLQVDERVAPDGHPDRNANILRVLAATGARVDAMPVTEPDLEQAAAGYARHLPARIDVVHLGVGADGHTASWPPGDPVIDADAPVAITGAFQGRVRMTLTPAVVNAARFRLVLATGTAKAVPVARWIAGDRQLPIARVRRDATLLVLDADAAPAVTPGG